MSLAPMRVVLVLAAACSGMNLRPKPTSDADQLPQVSASKKPPELLIDYEVTAGSSVGLLRVEARGLGVAWGGGCCLGWCVRANGEGALTLPRTSTPTHTHPHPSTQDETRILSSLLSAVEGTIPLPYSVELEKDFHQENESDSVHQEGFGTALSWR